MEKQEFTYKNGFVKYETVGGFINQIYVDSKDMEMCDEHWNNLQDVEKSFNELLEQGGNELDAVNRKDLFIFMYACSKDWIK